MRGDTRWRWSPTDTVEVTPAFSNLLRAPLRQGRVPPSGPGPRSRTGSRSLASRFPGRGRLTRRRGRTLRRKAFPWRLPSPGPGPGPRMRARAQQSPRAQKSRSRVTAPMATWTKNRAKRRRVAVALAGWTNNSRRAFWQDELESWVAVIVLRGVRIRDPTVGPNELQLFRWTAQD